MIKKEESKKLENFEPNELEEIKNQVKTITTRIDAAEQLIHDLARKIEEAEEAARKYDLGKQTAAAGSAIAAAIENLAKQLTGQRQVVTESPSSALEKPTDIKTQLNNAGVDISVLTFEGNIIKPAKFLADLWAPINNVLSGAGYTWTRDGKDSRWVGSKPTQESTSAVKPREVKNPGDPASEKQKAWLSKQGIPVKEGLTKGEASELVGKRMGEIDAKKKK